MFISIKRRCHFKFFLVTQPYHFWTHHVRSQSSTDTLVGSLPDGCDDAPTNTKLPFICQYQVLWHKCWLQYRSPHNRCEPDTSLLPIPSISQNFSAQPSPDTMLNYCQNGSHEYVSVFNRNSNIFTKKLENVVWKCRPLGHDYNVLTHLSLVTHICVSESGQHWFR